jgi:glycosyltransferase involved in cell wall biosynthesis
LVSVIINCHNGREYLHAAIKSVLTQTYGNWEIVLWDNASDQDIGEIARSFGDGRIRYFRGETMVPLGEARNLVMERAEGELIAFLDSDDLWRPAKLERMVPLFDDPDVGLVFSDVESFNTRGGRKRLGATKQFQRGHCFGSLLADYFLVMSSAMVRRATLHRHAIRFRPEYDMVEEVDVFLRLAYVSKIDFSDEVLAEWRVHSSSTVWRRFHLLADEMEHLLGEMIRVWPEIEQRYANELNIRRIWIVRQRAIGLWMKGDGRGVRDCLGGFRGTLPLKVCSLYLLSWLDARRWLPIMYRLFGANISP